MTLFWPRVAGKRNPCSCIPDAGQKNEKTKKKRGEEEEEGEEGEGE